MAGRCRSLYLKMRVIIIIILTCSFSNKLYAQQDTTYLNHSWTPTSKDSASYYRLLIPDESSSNKVIVRDYYISGTLQMDGFFKNSAEQILDGICTFYFENGQKSSQGYYQNNMKFGTWKFWYKNGQLKEVKRYGNKVNSPYEEYDGIATYNYWDSLGNQMVKNGTGHYTCFYENDTLASMGSFKYEAKVGTWKGFYEDGSPRYLEEYKSSGKLSNGISYHKNGSIFNYTEIVVNPVPVGGIEKFFRKLGKTLKYPAKARKNSIQGQVYVQFLVDRNGQVSNIKTVQGIGYGCDEAAEDCIAKLIGWIPGKVRGQKESIQMILPINFVLN